MEKGNAFKNIRNAMVRDLGPRQVLAVQIAALVV